MRPQETRRGPFCYSGHDTEKQRLLPASPTRTHQQKAARQADGSGALAGKIMSRIRKRILLERAVAVPENEPLSSNAVADALLMLAVAKGGDIRRHIELAQVAKEEMASGIECGAMEQDARDEFVKILKNRGTR